MRLLALLMAASVHALRVPLHPTTRQVDQRTRCAAPVLVAEKLEEAIRTTVTSNDVVIYSKSWCPYCAQCKALFDDLSVPYVAVELDQRDDGEQLQAALLELTQQRTVPNVFVAGQHVGGNDDTQQASQSGKLATLLEEAGRAESFSGRVVPTGGTGSSVTAAQRKAVAEFKMITETEATIRKAAGVAMGVATLAVYSTSGMAYTTLSGAVFGALSVYRSGAAYQ